ncbi:hypothetical protein BJ912DRAFT_314800 [Pholiota molesta]|nr:hypothetical protein BJ912DRAFT_314800 [Pholiota molesta]
MGGSSRPRAAQGIGRRPLGLAVLHRRVSPHLLLVVICRGPSCSCIASVDLRPLFLLLGRCRGQEGKDISSSLSSNSSSSSSRAGSYGANWALLVIGRISEADVPGRADEGGRTGMLLALSENTGAVRARRSRGWYRFEEAARCGNGVWERRWCELCAVVAGGNGGGAGGG